MGGYGYGIVTTCLYIACVMADDDDADQKKKIFALALYSRRLFQRGLPHDQLLFFAIVL
jgi:hypothetical protein